MHGNTTRHASEAGDPTAEVSSDRPPRRLFTLPKFADRHKNFLTLPALTNQVFKSHPRHSSKGQVAGNGMLKYGVIVRCNRRVYVDEDAYFRWLDARTASYETFTVTLFESAGVPEHGLVWHQGVSPAGFYPSSGRTRHAWQSSNSPQPHNL